MDILIKSPINKNEYKLYYQFRWETLRKPLLQPKGSEKDVMNLFIQINNLLTGRSLYLETLTLDARGSWSFTIKPQIEIKLGKTEINQKLERFFLALDQSLLAKINKVSYIDLRYSEGLAVSWKK